MLPIRCDWTQTDRISANLSISGSTSCSLLPRHAELSPSPPSSECLLWCSASTPECQRRFVSGTPGQRQNQTPVGRQQCQLRSFFFHRLVWVSFNSDWSSMPTYLTNFKIIVLNHKANAPYQSTLCKKTSSAECHYNKHQGIHRKCSVLWFNIIVNKETHCILTVGSDGGFILLQRCF